MYGSILEPFPCRKFKVIIEREEWVVIDSVCKIIKYETLPKEYKDNLCAFYEANGKEFIIDLRAKLLGYLNFALKNFFIVLKYLRVKSFQE